MDDRGEVGKIIKSRIPFIVVISGPSGVGKSTIVDRTLEVARRFRRSVSLTSRKRRKGDKDGVHYKFVNRQEFLKRCDNGELYEWAEIYGDLYGTRAEFVEKTLAEGNGVLLEIDIQGGDNVKKRRADAVLIFLLPPSFEELERRLRSRKTDSEEDIENRLEIARKELNSHDMYDYLVVNDVIERCVEDVLSIIRSESLKRDRASL